MRYLPAQAQDLLFERMDALSAPGSWLASNVPAEGFIDPDRVRRQREDMQRMRAAAAELVDAEITDFDDLWYPEERTAVDDWLRERGWDVSASTFADLMARYGRTVPRGRRLDAADTFRVRAARTPGQCQRLDDLPRSFDRGDRVDRREVLALAVLPELRPTGAVGAAQLVPDLAHLGQQFGSARRR